MKIYNLAHEYYQVSSLRKFAAIRTGAFRAPRKGEWYLSGAIPEAYRAENDMSEAYYILKLIYVP